MRWASFFLGDSGKVQILRRRKFRVRFFIFEKNHFSIGDTTQLFKLLAENISKLRFDVVEFYTTVEDSALSTSPETQLDGISPGNHKEANTRIILHEAHAAQRNFKNVW